MTDLSRFEEHTTAPWSVEVDYMNGDGDIANDADLALIDAAPKLLARVKELEEFLSVLSRGVPSNVQAVENLLNKEWLDV